MIDSAGSKDPAYFFLKDSAYFFLKDPAYF